MFSKLFLPTNTEETLNLFKWSLWKQFKCEGTEYHHQNPKIGQIQTIPHYLTVYLRCWWTPVRPGVETSSSSPRRWVWMEARWPGVTWTSLRLLTPHRCPACPRLTSSSRRAPPAHPREKTSSTSEELVRNADRFELQIKEQWTLYPLYGNVSEITTQLIVSLWQK